MTSDDTTCWWEQFMVTRRSVTSRMSYVMNLKKLELYLLYWRPENSFDIKNCGEKKKYLIKSTSGE